MSCTTVWRALDVLLVRWKLAKFYADSIQRQVDSSVG
jgi:hypothetical protein